MWVSPLLVLVFAASARCQDPFTTAKDSNGYEMLSAIAPETDSAFARNTLPAYSPARPPAIPLAVRSPYTNAWSSTSRNGTLNTNGVIYWWVAQKFFHRFTTSLRGILPSAVPAINRDCS